MLFAGLHPSWAQAVEAACGEDTSQSEARRAHDCHSKGLELFESGDFRQSKAFFEKARALHPRPIMQYNIGSCCEAIANESPDTAPLTRTEKNEKLAHIRCAIDAFEQYLSEEPSSPKRAALLRRIDSFRAREQALVRPPPAPKPSKKPPPKGPPPSLSPAPWIIAGGGALGLVAGIVLAALAVNRSDDAQAAEVQIERAELHDEATTLALGANIAFVGGGVLMGAGIAWGIVDVVFTNQARAQVSIRY
ncbi:MAG TPA: hypothetical protein VFB62_24490 [Polyangiaceae bacterium]|jgi:hypothetical protein|nr:hypothetical protein [Polyangiaceae bacterium]